MDPNGVPLDLGRRARLFSPAQQRAHPHPRPRLLSGQLRPTPRMVRRPPPRPLRPTHPRPHRPRQRRRHVPPPPHPRPPRLETLARHRRIVVSRTSMITEPAELGSVLGVWGHPDDEAYLSAGLMMGALAAGNRVVCVTATHGEAGFPDDDPRSLAERAAVRELELARVPRCLGRHRARMDAVPGWWLRSDFRRRTRRAALRAHRGGAARHRAHLQPGRPDRPRRSHRGQSMDHTRLSPCRARRSAVLRRHDPGVGRGLHGCRSHRSGDDGRGHGAAHDPGLRLVALARPR